MVSHRGTNAGCRYLIFIRVFLCDPVLLDPLLYRDQPHGLSMLGVECQRAHTLLLHLKCERI